MTAPPPYPRTPYLIEPESGARGDRVLGAADRAAWFTAEVVVEEKLDGANVSVWWGAGGPRVASRGGVDAMDRGRQLGALRARVAQAYPALYLLLDGGWVAYAEWLWLTHTVFYDRLPDHLVVLDLWHPTSGFATPSERDDRLLRRGLVGPPTVFRGVLGTAGALHGLLGPSRFGSADAEGLVLRRADGMRCKVVRPGFIRAGDEEIGRTRNRTAV